MVDSPSSTPALPQTLQALVQALTHARSEDAFGNPLTPMQWEIFAPYLQRFPLKTGQVLFAQGAQDHALYLVEGGSLSVHYEDAKQRLRLAVVTAGALLGEGAFFSHRPRSATVQAMAPSVVWTLLPLRFSELCNRHPEIALVLSQAAGSVLSRRLPHRRRRIAST